MRTSPRTSLHARHSNSSLTLAPQRAFTYACASRSIVRGSEFAREIFQRTCAQLRDRDSGDETGRRQQRYLLSPLSALNVEPYAETFEPLDRNERWTVQPSCGKGNLANL